MATASRYPNPERVAHGEKCRRRPTKALKQQLLEAQGYCCFACTAALLDVEYDHVIPLGLGGSNASDNWAALCPACHRSKTRQDLRLIAKAKRRRRYQETGRSRAPHSGWGGSKGFDKTLRKRMDGQVEKRCECALCRSLEVGPENQSP